MRGLVFFFLVAFSSAYGQGTSYSIKSVWTVGIQNWSNLRSTPLWFKPGVAIEIENYSLDDRSSLFAQIGYLTRGSGTRYDNFTNLVGERVETSGSFAFNNLNLLLGARGKKALSETRSVFYTIGVHGEYTLSDNLDQYAEGSTAVNAFPFSEFVNDITLGITVGGGMSIYLSDAWDVVFELQLHQDFTKQYDQPPLGQVRNPQRPDSFIDIPARAVRNTAIELMIGLRWLR